MANDLSTKPNSFFLLRQYSENEKFENFVMKWLKSLLS
jgi:hypothetical protein